MRLVGDHEVVGGEVEIWNVQPDRSSAAEPKVMEKAEEGNVPQTFRSRLRSCAGEERLIGVETRPTRVAVRLAPSRSPPPASRARARAHWRASRGSEERRGGD
jgi:hypothetical protein